MIRKTGYLKNSFAMVNFDLECPIHSGVTNLVYPPASIPNTTAVEYAINMVYCPSGTGFQASGHTFPLEMSNATVYSAVDSNTQTGTGLQASSSIIYSGVPVLTYLNWF